MRTTFRFITTLALTLFGFGLTGCAAIFNGTTETLYVRSEEPDTRFYLNERDLGTGTSAVTTVRKKELGRATFRTTKDGCNTQTMPVQTAFDPVTLLGVFIDFGIISIVGIDWLATGAVTKAAQTDYVLTPECGNGNITWLFGSPTPAEQDLRAILTAQTPTRYR